MHFYRAYQVSEFRLISESRGYEGGGMLPASLSETVGAVRRTLMTAPVLSSNPNEDFTHMPLEPDNREWTEFTGAALYTPLPYLPQAFGIFLGRIFSLTPLTLHYIARVCSLLTWALMGMAALKITPFFRNVVFILLLTPLVFSKAVVITADVVTVGACALLVCQILRMEYGERSVSRKDIFLLFGFAALVGLCKISYAPLAALCFLISPERLGGKKRFWLICVGAVFTALAVNMLWMGYLSANLTLKAGTSAHPSAQVRYMLSQPLSFLKVVWRYTYENGLSNFGAMFGTVIIWRVVWMPVWVIIMLWAAVLYAAVTDTQAADIRAWKKAGVAAVVLGVYVVIIASLYVSYTRPMLEWVQGMQARYMFPLLLPLLLVLKRKKPYKKNISMIYVFATGISLAVLVVSMYSRVIA